MEGVLKVIASTRAAIGCIQAKLDAPDPQTAQWERQAWVEEVKALQRQLAELLMMENRLAGASAAGATVPAADTSREYIRQCITPVEVFNTAQLHDALLAPLGCALPVNSPQRFVLVQGDASLGAKLASVQEEAEVGTAHMFRDWVSVAITHQFALFSFFVADAIINIFARYFPELRISIDCDIVDRSGGARLRPDLLCRVCNALLFKGEHKADRSQFDAAVNELRAKMAKPWDPELQPGVPLPFMLAYAAAGSLLQFFAIETSAASGDVQVVPISPKYDLTLPAHRVEALHATCNVFRILRHTALAIPAIDLGLGQRLVARDGDGRIVRFIHKRIPEFRARHEGAGINDLAQLEAAYEATAGQPGVIQVYTGGSDGGPRLDACGDYIVHLSPVGRPNHGAPSAELERKAAVRAVLEALAALHAKGLVHRDVRWPNLIRTARGAWLLIDLEHVGDAGRSCPPALPLCHAPGMLEAGSIFTTASDLVMVAQQLLSGAPGPLVDELRQQLQARSLTAVEALQHAWFSHPP
ncbi:hypothetical protein TSOC_011738 [Tetrabaena socialis]|uniref:Protein kinase domain-containing protein n=1 Tax=Tetrabaena socialis TaxID=47790 RepID=A0A2J7ZPU4_9CHLO|nr:hypothetical protein TSOC_011738 [Tetrabaena socialis]|eukprot:PNH02294.1 hypothetical protein TSOC_011738 [Tetrabaena socialis]